MSDAAEIKVPAHIQRFVDTLGPEDAIKFLLAFGGGDLYIPLKPQSRSQLVEVLGRHKAEKLGHAMGPASVRVPVAKQFIAKWWRANGVSVIDIARGLHVTDVTVRKWLNNRKSSRQLSFFD